MDRDRDDVKTPVSATFDSGSKSQQILLDLLIVMVPSVGDESVQIVGTLFYVK